jgi:hypothetical protein
MEATIKYYGPNPTFKSPGGETLQIEKIGGKLGGCSRFYTVSRIARGMITDPSSVMFVDMVDALGTLVGKPSGNTEVECSAFRTPALNAVPEDWTEVAGYNWNGASIEQIIEEVKRDENL